MYSNTTSDEENNGMMFVENSNFKKKNTEYEKNLSQSYINNHSNMIKRYEIINEEYDDLKKKYDDLKKTHSILEIKISKIKEFIKKLGYIKRKHIELNNMYSSFLYKTYNIISEEYMDLHKNNINKIILCMFITILSMILLCFGFISVKFILFNLFIHTIVIRVFCGAFDKDIIKKNILNNINIMDTKYYKLYMRLIPDIRESEEALKSIESRTDFLNEIIIKNIY